MPSTAQARRKRIDWMVAHRDLWYGMEWSKKNFRECARLMVAEGLYAPSTTLSSISFLRLYEHASRIIDAYEEAAMIS